MHSKLSCGGSAARSFSNGYFTKRPLNQILFSRRRWWTLSPSVSTMRFSTSFVCLNLLCAASLIDSLSDDLHLEVQPPFFLSEHDVRAGSLEFEAFFDDCSAEAAD